MSGPTHRYLFIGGLHRSGTSLTCRLATTLPGVAGIENAPVPENEGVYLQGGIPHHAKLGAPMQFATDPAQHMTEDHRLNRLDTRLRIEADWDPWFRQGATWRVEKSPVNMVRMRLLQQLFPLSQFIIVVRHPEAVAAAVAKWTDTPAPALIDHWIAAQTLALDDVSYLHNWLILRYEDIVRDPRLARARMAAFLDLTVDPWRDTDTIFDGNATYRGATRLSPSQASGVADWGYGAGLAVAPLRHAAVGHSLRSVRTNVLSVPQP